MIIKQAHVYLWMRMYVCMCVYEYERLYFLKSLCYVNLDSFVEQTWKIKRSLLDVDVYTTFTNLGKLVMEILSFIVS